ncbi:MAG: PDGLE domain-containing protein, partial [Planctomycetes bacterium]|nr:PDGLE domain-containing protein [Planctomycetota bacterium]
MTKQTKVFVIAGLGVSLVMGGVISFWASSHPDGLEWVAGEKGFEDKATENEIQKDAAPIPDYEVPGVHNDFLKVSLAGVIGTLICFGLALLLGWVLKRRKHP